MNLRVSWRQYTNPVKLYLMSTAFWCPVQWWSKGIYKFFLSFCELIPSDSLSFFVHSLEKLAKQIKVELRLKMLQFELTIRSKLVLIAEVLIDVGVIETKSRRFASKMTLIRPRKLSTNAEKSSKWFEVFSEGYCWTLAVCRFNGAAHNTNFIKAALSHIFLWLNYWASCYGDGQFFLSRFGLVMFSCMTFCFLFLVESRNCSKKHKTWKSS